MKSIKKTLLFLFTVVILANLVLAVRYIDYTIEDGSSNPLTNVDVLGHYCTSASCATVGGNISSWTQNPVNTGGSNNITLSYPTTIDNANGYAIYFFKEGYVPYEEANNWAGTGNASSPVNPYNLTKATNCSAAVSITVTSSSFEQIDVNTSSPINLTNNGVDYEPANYISHYIVNTNVTLRIYNSSNSLLNTSSQNVSIFYSNSTILTFNWNPPYDDNFSYIATSEAIDAKCESASIIQVNSTTVNSTVNYTSGPVISNVLVSSITNQSAIVTWNTNRMSNSTVRYGTVSATYTNSQSNSTYVLNHTISLSSLTLNTTYFFVVNNSNGSLNSQSSEYNFTTLANVVDNSPVVTLNSPAASYVNNTNTSLVQVMFNCSATDDNSLINISLYLTNNVNASFALNQTTVISGISNQSTWNVNLTNGNYTWNCLVYDNASQSDWGTNRSIVINYTAPVVNSIKINEFVFDQMTDWDQSGVVDAADEWVELYNPTGSTINVTNWNLTLIDASPSSMLLNGTIAAGAFMLIQNPAGSLTVNDGQLTLYNSSGFVMDNYSYGTYGSGPNVNAASIADECTGRNTNGVDTDNDANDFSKRACTYNSTNNDTSVPFLSNINASSVFQTSAFITWASSEFANSSVFSTGGNNANSTLIRSHNLSILGLTPSTSYFYNVTSCDASGNCNISTQYNFTTLANQAGQWYGNLSSIVTTYSSSTQSIFNISWVDDINMSTVYLESNFSGSNVNYSMNLIAGTSVNGTYNFSTILPAGNFYWRSHANDSYGQWNTTDTWTFTVVQAASVVNLTLNSLDSNVSIQANTDLNISAYVVTPNSGEMLAYNNGTLIYNGSSPSQNITQYNASGLYNITVVYPATQNYSSSFDTLFANVTGDVTVINSYIKNVLFGNITYTALQLNASIYRSTINVSNATGPTININDSYVFNSTFINAEAYNCTILDSTFNGGICRDSTIDPSDVVGSNVTSSNITDSHVYYSTVNGTNVTNSTVDNSTLVDSSISLNSTINNATLTSVNANNINITHSTMTRGTFVNSTLNMSTLTDTNATNSVVENSVATSSTLTDSNVTLNSNISSSTLTDSNAVNSNVSVGSNLTNSAATNSVIGNSTVNQNSNITSSTLTDSNVANSNVSIGSTITDANVSSSTVVNSTINTASNVTSSTVVNSVVSNSTINTASNVTNSNATSSTVTNSTVVNTNATNIVATSSTITNSSLSNTNMTNATIQNNVIYNGTIVLPNGTVQNITGPTNLTQVVNYAPVAGFTTSISNLQVTITDTSTDSNEGGSLNNTWNYYWTYGNAALRSSTIASTDDSHVYTYNSAGTYTITMNITDAYGETDIVSTNVTVVAAASSSSSGGGGSSKGGSSITTSKIIVTFESVGVWIAKNQEVNFEFKNETHKVTLLDFNETIATIKVESTPIVRLFSIGEKIIYDLDEDGIEDLSVSLSRIEDNRARVVLKFVGGEKEEFILEKEESKPLIKDPSSLPRRVWREEVKAEETDEGMKAITGGSVARIKDALGRVKNKLLGFKYLRQVLTGIGVLLIIFVIMYFNKKSADNINSNKKKVSKKGISKQISKKTIKKVIKKKTSKKK